MQIESFALHTTIDRFHQKALQWAMQFDEICFLNSNGLKDEWSKYDSILAVNATSSFFPLDEKDALNDLEIFLSRQSERFIPGFFSYDLKNQIEPLSSNHPDETDFPQIFFFIPETTIWIENGHTVTIRSPYPKSVFEQINRIKDEQTEVTYSPIGLKTRWTKTEYLEAFSRLQQHIQRGDLYEANLCQEFYGKNVRIDPITCYLKLNAVSPTPFSSFFKIGDKFIISASPERFLAKRKNTLISQPIKGTARRGETIEEDRSIVERMLSSEKEKSENVMIVDLVRNDLTRSAVPGTVKVKHLFDIHSFRHVHQMISTITCEQSPNISDIESIRNTFPAGSMTGAPKIAAMRICEDIEVTSRGVYAGSIGYFDTQYNEFDFNVVIRSIVYNKQKQYLSFHTGGAITNQANGEQEYEECLIKASAILTTLNATLFP